MSKRKNNSPSVVMEHLNVVADESVVPVIECKLIGQLDECDAKGIRGWVINESNLNEPVTVDVFIDSGFIAQVTANIFRQDLLSANIGNGFYAFNVPVPSKFFDGVEHRVEIKHALSEQLLDSCPKSFILSPDAMVKNKEEAIDNENDGVIVTNKSNEKKAVTPVKNLKGNFEINKDLIKADINTLGVFLLCTGQHNIALIPQATGKTEYSLQLIIDNQLSKLIESSETSGESVFLNINRIFDAGFLSNVLYWKLVDTKNSDRTLNLGIDLTPAWTLADGHTAYLAQLDKIEEPVELIYHDPILGAFLPVSQNNHYQIGGYFGLHRCDAVFEVKFYDADKKFLQSHEIPLSEGMVGGQLLSNYLSVATRLITPKKAAFAMLILKKLATKQGNDSFFFFTRLFFALVSPTSFSLLSWSANPFNQDDWKKLNDMNIDNLVQIDFQLPETVYDGQNHSIQLIDCNNGQELEGSPKAFWYEDDIQGKVEALQGSQIKGWVSSPELKISLYVDEQSVADGTSAMTASEKDKFTFTLSLPNLFLDGRPHRIAVKATLSGKSIGELAEITPYIATSWDAIQKYTSKPFPAKLSPAAAYRYDSICASLAAFSEAAKDRQGAEWSAHIDYIARLGCLHEQLLAGFERTHDFDSLVFPLVESPTISIVIPVHNKFSVTYNCLVALLFAYNRASFEVILVDDGSSDKTVEVSELVSGITCLCNETAQGFIRSCNRGASVARGKYVVMLNNDTEPTTRWLDEMLFVFEHFDDIGLVGSKLLYPDGKLQEAGGIVWKTGNPWNYGRGANPHDPRFNYTRQVDYLSGASIMLPKLLWDSIGGFSEEYCPAYFEDTDLAFKVREAGLKTVYAPLSVVYHFEGLSSGTSVASGIKRYQEINRPIFKRNWIQACYLNGEQGINVDLNKDRGIHHRALVIDHQIPKPDMDAGSYAAIQEIRLLQSLGFKVTFMPENLAYLGQYTESLQRLGIEVIHAPFVSSVADFFIQRGNEFDVVYITRYEVAKNNLRLVRQYSSQAKVLFCNADLHFLRELREAIQHNSKDMIDQACLVREEELSIMRQVDVTLSYNAVEHAIVFSHNLDATKIVTCPWVVEVQENIPGFSERVDIAFLGGFGHPPNKKAVLFFVNQVMPILRKQLPGAKFRIYGSNVPNDIIKMASSDIIIEGYVKEVNEVYDSCRVFVAPLLTGAGIKGKVIDALAHGIPSVLTPIAVEGTLLRHELEVMVAETAQEWADAVTRLYTDQSVWDSLSKAASDFARRYYSFEQGRKLMLKALETVDFFVASDNQALVVKQTRPSVN